MAHIALVLCNKCAECGDKTEMKVRASPPRVLRDFLEQRLTPNTEAQRAQTKPGAARRLVYTCA